MQQQLLLFAFLAYSKRLTELYDTELTLQDIKLDQQMTCFCLTTVSIQ